MKKGRHEAIIELIRNNDIENQSELAYRLQEKGYDVTQATVSRDIQKLNLIKVKSNGKFKYAVVENVGSFEEKYIKIIIETVKSLDIAKEVTPFTYNSPLIILVCYDEIVGSLAGDDAIFIATKSDDNAMLLKNKLEVLMRKDV